MSDTERQLKRWESLEGPNLGVHDGPGGRVLTYIPSTVAEPEPAPLEIRYDVITIGGWSVSVAGLGYIGDVETVNDFFGEKNHIFLENATAAEVNSGRWAWGRGTTETHFAIAAILQGTRNQIPNYENIWYNEIVPAEILVARAIGENALVGGPIALTLQIPKIGG